MPPQLSISSISKTYFDWSVESPDLKKKTADIYIKREMFPLRTFIIGTQTKGLLWLQQKINN